jgi:hypothetical protein
MRLAKSAHNYKNLAKLTTILSFGYFSAKLLIVDYALPILFLSGSSLSFFLLLSILPTSSISRMVLAPYASSSFQAATHSECSGMSYAVMDEEFSDENERVVAITD